MNATARSHDGTLRRHAFVISGDRRLDGNCVCGGAQCPGFVYDVMVVENGCVAGRTAELVRLLGALGAEVMDVLWSVNDPVAVREVMDRLNAGRTEPLAYTTVMTVLTRLAERGAARRTKAGRGYVYEAAVSDAAELAVRDVVRDHGVAAVAHFVNHALTDPELLQRLERLMGSADTDSEGRSG